MIQMLLFCNLNLPGVKVIDILRILTEGERIQTLFWIRFFLTIISTASLNASIYFL